MAKHEIDARGWKCPVPTLKLNNLAFSSEVKSGDTIAVTANCPTFETDIREWCKRMKKVLVVFKDAGDGAKYAEVRV